MAWSAPRTWNVGEFITKAIMDVFIRDNQVYLKSQTDLAILETGANPFTADQPMGGNSLTGLAAGVAAGESVRYDELHKASQATPANVLGVVYLNGAKTRIVTITVRMPTGAACHADVEDANPPTIRVVNWETQAGAGLFEDIPGTFVVPPNWRYSCFITLGVPILVEWAEWDLH